MNDDLVKKERFYYIDRLKVFGLLLVILAHVDLPIWIAQIRSFDVPLLVLVSAFLAQKSYRGGAVGAYYKKRFLRLAVPAWIFAMVFWLVQSVALTPPTVLDVLKGLTFQRDTNMLGMLWIIWVYIICALLIPIIDKMKFNAKSQALWLVLVVLFQFLCSFTTLSDNRFLYCTFFTVIPYGFVTWLGYYYNSMSDKVKRGVIWGSIMLFVLSSIILYVRNGALSLISDYKYPAQLYFLSYAIAIAFLLFQWLPKLDIYKTSDIVRFISKSSLWIYLWHILVLYAAKMFIENPQYWWLQYIIVVSGSVVITWVQNKLVDWLLSKFGWKGLTVFKG